MDAISAAVLCSSSATAPPAAAVGIAPMVVQLPSGQHHQPHQHLNNESLPGAPPATPVDSASSGCKLVSTGIASWSPVKGRESKPMPVAVPLSACTQALQDAEEAKLHSLSFVSIKAPELTPLSDGEEAAASVGFSVPAIKQQSPTAAAAASTRQQVVNSKLAAEALNVLRTNDLGGYTIPATGLYPYQWNWDSALVAMGWSAVDEERAWEELDKLFSAQWEDGMVPHIVFHKASPTYFPGPEIWGYKDKPMKSTGITQPPIAATAVRRILENQIMGVGSSMSPKSGASAGEDWEMRPVLLPDLEGSSACSTSSWRSPSRSMAEDEEADAWIKAAELFPKLLGYHRWFFAARDPEHTGLVATLHPWESGMDNSPAWDVPLANVPVDEIPPYTRRDLGHVDAAMRPHQSEYDRYLTLLYRFRSAAYDPDKLYWLSPFRVTDVCTNSLLHRANLDLRWLAISLNRMDCLPEIDSWLAKSSAAFDSLWDNEVGIFRSKDQLTGEPLQAATSGGFLPLFARVASPEQAERLAGTLEKWLDSVSYGVPSLDPTDPRFEGLRYWRGPVWAIVNYMIVDGLRYYGYPELANRIETDTLELVQKSGLFEYYDPTTGQGAGGSNFSWTAAMVLSWLEKGSAAEAAAAAATEVATAPLYPVGSPPV